MIELPIWLVVVIAVEIVGFAILSNFAFDRWNRAERELLDLRWDDFARRHPEIADPRNPEIRP